MPKAWGRVSRAELDLRPGGIVSIDIAVKDGPEVPNVGCVLEVVPMERLVWTSMLFPGYRPAVFDDIPITAIMTMEAVGTRHSLHLHGAAPRRSGPREKQESGFYQGHRDRRRSVRGARARDEVARATRAVIGRVSTPEFRQPRARVRRVPPAFLRRARAN